MCYRRVTDMGSKVDRIGEKNINNFGSEMIIVNSYTRFNDKHKRNYTYIDVLFPQYNWIAKGVQYDNFKKGSVKCPYERTIYGVGYIGEGKYKVSENSKKTRIYATWSHMLERCYDEKIHKKRPTYKDCSASEKFHNFQNFAKWYEDNYYEVEGERMCLDKDILVKGNKIYSPETCILGPQTINSLFVKRQNDRGESVIGTSLYKNGKYQVNCSLLNPETGKSKKEHLGYYETQEKAFEVYKYYKEKNNKMVADYFKDIYRKNYMMLYIDIKLK